MSNRIEKYTGMVIQPAVTVAKTREDIRKNLDRVCNLIDFGVGYFWERPVRLIVLPEYFLQGVTTPGKGEAGSRGGSNGDLYLFINVHSHELFKRSDENLFFEFPLSLADAALGTTIEIPTIDGKKASNLRKVVFA